HATLEALKDSIRAVYQTPALENDGAVFNVVCDSGKYSPRNDQALREMLRLLVSKNNLKFTVFIATPSKAFSDWTLGSVCQLFNLSAETEDPTLAVFPPFSCGNTEPSQEVFKNLILELTSRLDITPINLISIEATKSIYVYSYLLAGANNFKGVFEVRPQKNLSGPNGHGPVDFAIDLRRTAKTVGVTEVKKDNFVKGVAQCAVQLESSLSNRKRKVDELEESPTVGKVFGIVTDAEKFYFMECSLDEQERPAFKLSKPVIVAYDDVDMEDKVKRVLSHIVWLLEEVKKADESENRNKKIKV
ncbi:6216_t:CDS:1, partial [Paraglomus brasilianum]